MKIVIVGAGALGSLFGGLLAHAGQEVWLFDPPFKAHIDIVRRKGLVIERDGGELRVRPHATTDIREIGLADLTAIFVKAQHTEEAVRGALPSIGESTRILSLQNGLGVENHILKYVREDRVLRGVTAQGSTLIEPGRIRHAGAGETKIGSLAGRDDGRSQEIVTAFNVAGIETVFEEDATKLVWSKLLINVGINALTAVFNVQNGVLVADKTLNDIMRAVVCEAVAVARKSALEVSADGAIEDVEEVCRTTSENISSMLQDVREERETEIDYINGAIAKKGDELGISTPLNKLLVKLVKSSLSLARKEQQGAES